MIVIAFGQDVQAYVENKGHQQCPRPKQCPHCGTVGRMTGHGSYRRKPKDLARAYQIRVKRWQCQHCQQTTSCLPSFLLSWRHYLVAVIQAVLVQRLEQGGSWSAIVHRCSQEGLPAVRTMQRWIAAFNERAATWLPDVSQTLAEQDSHSPWLEPRPPTEVGGQSAAPSAGTLLLAGMFTQSGQLISNRPDLVFDLRSVNERERELPVQFVLTHQSEEAEGQEIILRLEERIPDTSHYREYRTLRYALRRSYTSDFDF